MCIRDSYSGVPQELNLPSAPKQFIQYLEEDNRPQISLDVNFENGMGISDGRLREETVYDWKFVGLSHNTVRGAAGGAVPVSYTHLNMAQLVEQRIRNAWVRGSSPLIGFLKL